MIKESERGREPTLKKAWGGDGGNFFRAGEQRQWRWSRRVEPPQWASRDSGICETAGLGLKRIAGITRRYLLVCGKGRKEAHFYRRAEWETRKQSCEMLVLSAYCPCTICIYIYTWSMYVCTCTRRQIHRRPSHGLVPEELYNQNCQHVFRSLLSAQRSRGHVRLSGLLRGDGDDLSHRVSLFWHVQMFLLARVCLITYSSLRVR